MAGSRDSRGPRRSSSWRRGATAIVGYAYGALEGRDWNLLLDAHGAVHDIFVAAEARRGGVGRQLVEALVLGPRNSRRAAHRALDDGRQRRRAARVSRLRLPPDDDGDDARLRRGPSHVAALSAEPRIVLDRSSSWWLAPGATRVVSAVTVLLHPLRRVRSRGAVESHPRNHHRQSLPARARAGRGTMGTVWLAQHLTLDVRCAVKFMSDEAAREPVYTARFALEARAIAPDPEPEHRPRPRLRCGRRRAVHRHGAARGRDLGAPPPPRAGSRPAATRRIVAQVARGLSPRTRRDRPPRPQAREHLPRPRGRRRGRQARRLRHRKLEVARAGGTQAGKILGTPAYMSPEQARVRQDDRPPRRPLVARRDRLRVPHGQPRVRRDVARRHLRADLVEPLPRPEPGRARAPPAFDAWLRARCLPAIPRGASRRARARRQRSSARSTEAPPRPPPARDVTHAPPRARRRRSGLAARPRWALRARGSSALACDGASTVRKVVA